MPVENLTSSWSYVLNYLLTKWSSLWIRKKFDDNMISSSCYVLNYFLTKWSSFCWVKSRTLLHFLRPIHVIKSLIYNLSGVSETSFNSHFGKSNNFDIFPHWWCQSKRSFRLVAICWKNWKSSYVSTIHYRSQP